MQKIEFTKMHGLGNDFVIIDRRTKNVEINDNLSRKWPNLTQKKDAMPEAEKYAEIKNKIGMLKET